MGDVDLGTLGRERVASEDADPDTVLVRNVSKDLRYTLTASMDLNYTFDEEYRRQLQLLGDEAPAAEAELFVVGADVQALREDGQWYDAKVEAVLGGRFRNYTVAWADGEMERRTQPQRNLRLKAPDIKEWDITRSSRKTGLNKLTMILPAVTRAATMAVGAALATIGYAAGKLVEVAGAGKAIDSSVVQAGMVSWMWSNGIVPTVQYEELGETAEQLAAVTGAEGALDMDDIRITPLILSNHICYMDGLVLATVFRGPKIVAMAGSRSVPVIGKFMEEMEVVFVDRSRQDSKKATLDAIKQQCEDWRPGSRPLLMFPEGTTTNGEALLDFKKGAFVSGRPVRPVILVYTGEWDPATTSWYIRQDGEVEAESDVEWAQQFLGHFIHAMHVRVLAPYIPSDEEKQDPELFARGVKAYMSDALVRVRRELQENSWKVAAGRDHGGLDYQLGDETRCLWRRANSAWLNFLSDLGGL